MIKTKTLAKRVASYSLLIASLSTTACVKNPRHAIVSPSISLTVDQLTQHEYEKIAIEKKAKAQGADGNQVWLYQTLGVAPGEVQNTGKPIVSALITNYDYNNALMYNENILWLPTEYDLAPSNIKNKEEFFEELKKAVDRKSEIIMLYFHGTQKSLTISKEEITVQDQERLQEILHNYSGTIAITACEAGKGNSDIAKVFKKASNAEIISPKRATYGLTRSSFLDEQPPSFIEGHTVIY